MVIDLAIIGGGPAGYVAAERASAKGLEVVLFEYKRLGGVCLNEGCIPTKTLLYSAKLFDQTKQGSKYGVMIPESGVEFSKIMSRKTKVVNKLVAGVRAKMKKHGITVINEWANILGEENGLLLVAANGLTYSAKNLLICSGSESVIPPIPGIENSDVLTSREVLNLKNIPQSLTIIGGGVIGMEFASLFNSLGTKVTVIERSEEILSGMDEEQCALIRTFYESKGLVFKLNSSVIKFNGKEVIYEQDGKQYSIENEINLISVGRRANRQGYGLESLNIETNKQGILVNEHMQTSFPNVYAAGDITGFSLLAHTASREAEVAVNHILGSADKINYQSIPAVVYTNPEIASVGLSEKAAKKDQIAYFVAKLPMTYSGRFVAENEDVVGMCKVIVCQQSHKILGVHILGNPSSEIIFGAAMAIEMGLNIEQMQKIVFPHPTVSEIFKETIFSME